MTDLLLPLLLLLLLCGVAGGLALAYRSKFPPCPVAAPSARGRDESLDPLTGLANREGLKRELRRRTAIGDPFAFLFVDLDRFLWINQTFGDDIGDDLLKTVAQRLAIAREPGESIARIGADQFIILAPLRDPALAAKIGARFNCAVDGEPYKLGQEVASVTASIGLARFPYDGRELGTLMGEAETALYQAKFDGGGRCQVVRNRLLHTGRARTSLPVEVVDAPLVTRSAA